MKAWGMQTVINACLGVLYKPDGHTVLLSCRPEGKLYAGYWEFPGGKLEHGESSYTALARELFEELGIEVLHGDMLHLTELEHQYPHGLVKLDIMLITKWHGEVVPRENQVLLWHDLAELTPPAQSLPTTETIFGILQISLAGKSF